MSTVPNKPLTRRDEWKKANPDRVRDYMRDYMRKRRAKAVPNKADRHET